MPHRKRKEHMEQAASDEPTAPQAREAEDAMLERDAAQDAGNISARNRRVV